MEIGEHEDLSSPAPRPVSNSNGRSDSRRRTRVEENRREGGHLDHDELKRELSFDDFDNNHHTERNDGGGNKREARSRSQAFLERHRSISMTSAAVGDEEDLNSRHIMEEKSIAGDDKAETGPAGDLPKEPDDQQQQLKPVEENKGRSDNEEDDDDDDEQDSQPIAAEGLYDPNEFVNLPVGSDIKELFQFITAYTPQVIEIDTALKPFILDYVPAVGDIDAFIKIPRPDDVEDNSGLLVLDEPCARQSDPTVLDLHLRAVSKDNLPKGTVVKKLARADRNPKEIENWIRSIGDLHKSKPATQVHYSKPMPDIDALMQEWPPEVEETLKQIDLPSADLEQMPLEQYVDTACALLDIPVYKSRIQSLHVLFTLYSEFKNSQHFRALAEENKTENAPSAQKTSGSTDRLVL